MAIRLLEFFRPFHLVVSRRVSEEESVTVEVFCKTNNEAQIVAHEVLAVMRDHRKRSNEEVVKVARDQLTAIDTHVNSKRGEMDQLEETLGKRREELRHLDELLAKRRTKMSSATLLRPNGPLA